MRKFRNRFRSTNFNSFVGWLRRRLFLSLNIKGNSRLSLMSCSHTRVRHTKNTLRKMSTYIYCCIEFTRWASGISLCALISFALRHYCDHKRNVTDSITIIASINLQSPIHVTNVLNIKFSVNNESIKESEKVHLGQVAFLLAIEEVKSLDEVKITCTWWDDTWRLHQRGLGFLCRGNRWSGV